MHAYQFDPETATFIVECSEATWRRFGFDQLSQDETIATCERVFARYLDGNRLMTNARHLRGSAWLIWGQALFVASGLIWLVILIPTQFLQARQARAFAEGGAIPQSYWRHSRRWVIWGTMQPSFL